MNVKSFVGIFEEANVAMFKYKKLTICLGI